MEKYDAKDLLKNISQKKFLYLIIIFLVIFSGFLLFNQISYLGNVYNSNRVKKYDQNVYNLN